MTQEVGHFGGACVDACAVACGNGLKHVAIDAHGLGGFGDTGRGGLYGMKKGQNCAIETLGDLRCVKLRIIRRGNRNTVANDP